MKVEREQLTKGKRFQSVILLTAILLLLPHQPVSGQEWNRTPREVQQSLHDKGFNPGAVDGIWGKKSAAALRAFQNTQNLPETGILDEATANSLFDLRDAVRRQLTRPVDQGSKPVVTQEPAAAVKTSRVRVETRSATDPDNAPEDAASPVAPSATENLERKPEPAKVESQVAPETEIVPKRQSDPMLPEQPTSVGTYLVTGGLLALFLWYRRRRKKRSASVGSEKLISTSPPAQNSRNSARDVATRTPPTASPSGARQEPSTIRLQTSPELVTALAAHNGKIIEAIRDRNAKQTTGQVDAQPSSQRMTGQVDTKRAGILGGWKSVSSTASSSHAASSGWIPFGVKVNIGPHVIAGGMIYVGKSLPQQNTSYLDENCLINPKLTIGRSGDPDGVTMGYWPSYSQMSPEARNSYLHWLAGPRADPSAYIGYVFLYFYGLERRLMLETNAPDAADVMSEVRRLLSIYGSNGSFRRYANALIEAYQAKSSKLPEHLSIELEENSYDIPMSLKVALGLQVGADAPMPPNLLLAYVMAHPETRVRTPAKRVDKGLLKQIFADELEKRCPKGVRISGKSGRKLKLVYHACSGTFESQIQPFGLDLIDVTNRKEPINTGRTIFDACLDQLDDYSRALGRSEGLRPTLSSVSKLPARYRDTVASALADRPLARLDLLAADGELVPLTDVAAIVGMDPDKMTGRAKLVELSLTLGAFGFGCSADPVFFPRQSKQDDLVSIFRMECEQNVASAPSESFRLAQLSSLLGLVIASADGLMHDLEISKLHDWIDADNELSPDECSRLKAEIKVHLADPSRLADMTRRLRDCPLDRREQIADILTSVAAADGVLHPKEVSQLEKIFRQMSLDPQSLYSRLHGQSHSSARDALDNDDDLPLIIEPTRGTSSVSIPPPPAEKSAFRVDASRLAAIRKETRAASDVLASIFIDEAELDIPTAPIEDTPAAIDDMDRFEGLERRYSLLLTKLGASEEWSSNQFGSLVREAGLMPAAAIEVLNNWSLDMFDDLLLEGEEPIIVNLHLLPHVSRSNEVALRTEERADL